MMYKTWSLYNKVEKLRIDDLRSDQVRTILLAIATHAMGDWYACQDGDLHWQSLLEISEFYEDTHQPKGEIEGKTATEPEPALAPQPQPQRRPMFEDAPEDAGSTLKVQSEPLKERRSARRFVRNLNFRLKHPGATFEAETRDASMSGISLQQPLPAGLPKVFKAELSLNGAVVQVVCSKAGDHQLKLMEADAWEVIRQWLMSW